MLQIRLTNQKSAFCFALALLAMLFSGQQATGATTDKAEKMLCSLERVHNNFGKGTKGFYASVELSDFTIFERDKAKPENLYSKLERKFNPFMNIYALQSPYPLRMSRIDLFQDGKLASRRLASLPS